MNEQTLIRCSRCEFETGPSFSNKRFHLFAKLENKQPVLTFERFQNLRVYIDQTVLGCY